MQDIHAIAGGSRLFSGGGGGGDRRLRPHLHQHQTNHQALKCPRCDSLNTKFCYYNNYNLSQPRHFCKSCRRYWTKGGVLRNVPVGGGCRKTKRSSKSKPIPESTPPPLPERKSSSHSSSENSSLTATTVAAAATEVISAPSSASTSVFTTQTQNGNQNFESDPPLTDCGIFSEIGSFTNMITSANDTLSFGFNNITGVTTPYQHLHQYETQQWQTPPHRAMNVSEELRMHEITTGYMDQTAQVDPNRSSNVVGGFGALDYGDHDDHQVLFDLPNTVDQAYWSQNHWTTTTTTTTDQAQDQSNLYLP